MLALVLASSTFVACGRAKPKDEAAFAPPRVVNARDVEFPDRSPQLRAIQTSEVLPAPSLRGQFTGRLAWNEDKTVRIFTPVAGRVERITADIGQRVAENDELGALRSPDFGQAQADFRKATSDDAQTAKTLDRQRALLAHGAAAQKDVDAAVADRARAAAELERATRRLRLLETLATDSSFTDLFTVRSPIAGVVVDRKVNPGQEVRPDLVLASVPELAAPLFIVSDPKSLWMWLDVPEAALTQLAAGQAVEVTAATLPGRTFSGRLSAVSAALDPITRVARARAVIDNPDGALRAEMYVSATVTLPETAAVEVSLPTRAVVYSDGKYWAYVARSDRRFERVEVVVGRDNGNSVVVSGQTLVPGLRVVTEGALLLNEILGDAIAGDTAH